MTENTIEVSATQSGWMVLVADDTGTRSKAFNFKELADAFADAESERLRVPVIGMRLPRR